MSGALLRRKVDNAIVRGNLDEAAAIARRIPQAWYRCQALAAVAKETENPKARTSLLDRAFAAALETEGPNRIVTVSSWCVGVLDHHGDTHRVAVEVDRLIDIIREEAHPVRRMDALIALHGAVHSEPVASKLQEEVMEAAMAAHGWKRDALLAGYAISAAKQKNVARALSFFNAIEIPRTKRRTARDLAELGVEVPG